MGELSPPDDEDDEDYNGDDNETSGGQYVDYDDGNDDEYDYLALLKVAHADDTLCASIVNLIINNVLCILVLDAVDLLNSKKKMVNLPNTISQ